MLTYQTIEKVRELNPLVHNITNIVVANDTANGLLALGASPFMSSAPEEVAEIATFANVVVLNIGTLTQEQVAAMLLSGKSANKAGTPVVLDPVGAGATAFRKETIKTLLQEIKIALIRGNAGEIAALAGVAWESKGVDAGEGSGDIAELAAFVAKKYQTIVAVSGATDIVTDGKTAFFIHNGTPYFTTMTGGGCLLSSVCGAYLAANKENPLVAIAEALAMYSISGEAAASTSSRTSVGSFRKNLLDELSWMNSKTAAEKANVERIEL